MRQVIIPDDQITTTVRPRKVKQRDRVSGFLDHDFAQFSP